MKLQLLKGKKVNVTISNNSRTDRCIEVYHSMMTKLFLIYILTKRKIKNKLGGNVEKYIYPV